MNQFYKFNQPLIFICDIIAIQVAFMVLNVTGLIQLNTSKGFLSFLLLANILWIFLSLLSRSFQFRGVETLSDHLSRVGMILIYYISLTGLCHFLGLFKIDIQTLLAVPLTAAILMLVQHSLFYKLMQKIKPNPDSPVYVIGGSYKSCEKMLDMLQKRGTTVKQYAVMEEPETGKVFRILELLRSNYIREIIICRDLSDHTSLSTLLRYCRFYNIQIRWHQPQTSWAERPRFNYQFPAWLNIKFETYN